jgi:hypothetical protein
MIKEKHIPKNTTGWRYARSFLGELYECEYLADTWPERLGLDDLAALQSVGKDYPVFEAWKICLKKVAESLELVTGKEFWWLGSDEPSEHWTRKKQRKILIPPCHKPKGDDDDILFFGGGALERDTVSPQDFADYLQEIGEQPSKYIAAWFDAYNVDMATAEPQSEAVNDNDSAPGTSESEQTKEWKKQAWNIGKEWMLSEEERTGERPGVVKISEYVEGEFSNRGITGPRGKFLDAQTIKREALKGITGRKANGK